MKKNGSIPIFSRLPILPRGKTRLLLTMKLSLFMIFAPVVMWANSSFAQQQMNIKVENASLSEVLKQVRALSGYFIFYNTEDIKDVTGISIVAENATVDEVLDKALHNTSLSYTIEDRTILISRSSGSRQQPQMAVTVRGTVRGEDGGPVTGATVVVKGTQIGTATDIDGGFTLRVANPQGAVFVFSFIGKQTLEIPYAGSDVIDVTMIDETSEIDAVVVNGIFERRANTFTGSVTTFKNEDLIRVGNSNILQSLRNLDPSLMYFDNMELGSDPNAVPQLAMRGKSNIVTEDIDFKATYQYDPNAPLFILDGFEVPIQKVMDLDMNRVETLTILKDASAKAIYGSKAANGVIVIELHKNPSGDVRVTYTGSIDIQAPDLSSYNLTNAAEKLELEQAYGMFYDEDGSVENTIAMNKLLGQRMSFVQSGIDTDWLSKPLTTGIGTKHGISVELGTGELRTIIDLSYNSIKGVMKESDRNTLSGGVSVSYRIKNLLFRNQLTINSNTANDSKYGTFGEYARISPYYTPYNAEGQIADNIIPQIAGFTGQSVTIAAWYRDVGVEANPLKDAMLNTVLRHKYIDVVNNFDIQWQMTDQLRTTARVGLIERRDHDDRFYPANHSNFAGYTDEDARRKGSYTMAEGRSSTLTGRLDVQYNKVFNDVHNFYTNAGFDLSWRSNLENITEAEGFPSDKMTDIMLALQYRKDGKPGGSEQTVREFGYYVALSYSFDDRINADATLRQNASSMYGAQSRWGLFWSMGISWNIHREKWMQGSVFDQLRLRASIGSTGSQSSSAYNAIATYRYDYLRSYEGMLGAQLMTMRNPDLRWQDKLDRNIALDISIRRKLMLTVEYYNSLTKNAMNSITLAPSTGFGREGVQENAGNVRNTGIELRSTWVAWQRPEDRSSFSLTLSALRNKNVLSEVSEALKFYNKQQNDIFNRTYANSERELEQKEQSRPVNKFYDGVSMDAIWAVQSLGIDPANGNEIFLVRDADGNFYRSYVYDANSQVILGDNLPKVQGNAGFSFNYKGFGLNVVMRYMWGGQMYNQTLVDRVENADIRYNVDRRIYTDRWRKEGDKTKYKRLQKTDVSQRNNYVSETTRPTSRFVQDRNELTISSVRLSYDFFRANFLKKIGMERMILAFYANDVHTFSSIRIERGTSYPFARTFSGSLTFTF